MNNKILTVGWREWFSLPELGLPRIKAKIDTGARTSCLHAFQVDPFTRDGDKWVRFGIHPHQDDSKTEVFCEAKVIDERMISDSGGHQENRYIIMTEVVLSEQSWPIEVSLTNRDTMKFRMLLGRTAMEDRIIVDASKSYLHGKPKSTRK